MKHFLFFFCSHQKQKSVVVSKNSKNENRKHLELFMVRKTDTAESTLVTILGEQTTAYKYFVLQFVESL